MPSTRVTSLLTAVIALGLLAGCGSPPPELSGARHEVRVTGGNAVGVEAAPGVLLWRDIPYAQPPLGALRWRAPRPVQPATSLIAAGDGSIACLQKANRAGGVEGEGIIGSEDCLYLDIRAPAAPASDPRPVMVWIHGGGNTIGYKGYYDFSALVASQDVIVVTLNYRLGPLGWFTHPAIQQAQSGLDAASNFGTLDIIQALHWVNNNIGAFGGDTGNITVFGESAGGHNVYALLASPLAEGLFHKAIVQSGYVRSVSLADAYNAGGDNPRIARSGWQLAEALARQGRPERGSGEFTAQELRAVDGRTLLETYQSLPALGYIPLTTADDVVIPRAGMMAALTNPDLAKHVPVIAGANRDEVTLWLGTHRYFVDADYPFTRWLPPRLRLKDPELYRFWVDVRSQAWKLRGVDEPLRALESAGYSALYAYRFDWDDQEPSFFADFPAILGAAHGTDISFISGNYRFGPITRYVYPAGPARDQMERTLMNAWAGFARNGHPTTPAHVTWRRFSASERAFLHLDTDDELRLAADSSTLEDLLAPVAHFKLLDETQQCLLVWDSLTKVGEPRYDIYGRWNQGQCANLDATRVQAEIDEELRMEYGSTGVL